MNKAVRVLLSQAINSHKLCNYSQHKCFDQVFGVLKRQGKAYVLTKERQEIPTLQSSKAAIIIILESPHIAEFDPITKQPLGPCQGKTGENIAMYLSKILKSNQVGLTLSHKEYDIVLLNAIQYQCSLGERTSKYRDKIFWMCWKHKDVRIDFCDRIHMALGTPNKKNIVVNCCTTGNLARSNHDLINIALEDMGISFFESTHPYGWINESKRRFGAHTNQSV